LVAVVFFTSGEIPMSGDEKPALLEIVNNRQRITADTAVRLSLYFGNSPEFWMNLQTHYDLKIARRNLDPKAIKRIKDERAA
jgi:plasmid maintenance system antidote protein VapI